MKVKINKSMGTSMFVACWIELRTRRFDPLGHGPFCEHRAVEKRFHLCGKFVEKMLH